MVERTLAEPKVISLAAWATLPSPISSYARRVAAYFKGQPVSIGVEVLGPTGPFRVWRCETRNGRRFYEVQLDTTPDQAEAHGP